MQPSSPTSLDRPFLTGQPDVVQLTFVRHGKQDMPSGAFTPALWADPPLSGLGQRQAAAVGKALAEKIGDAIASVLWLLREARKRAGAAQQSKPSDRPETPRMTCGLTEQVNSMFRQMRLLESQISRLEEKNGSQPSL